MPLGATPSPEASELPPKLQEWSLDATTAPVVTDDSAMVPSLTARVAGRSKALPSHRECSQARILSRALLVWSPDAKGEPSGCARELLRTARDEPAGRSSYLVRATPTAKDFIACRRCYLL